ncbi:MAG TPA: BatD family protein [Dysgonamonadaceae bacterium]|nr:BatD family protein [Dysgonamonadaceae bacterium]
MINKNFGVYIKIILLLFFLQGHQSFAQEVIFKGSAPQGVVKGEQFRLTYVLNKEGKDIRLPSEMKGFEIRFGPSVSSSYSTQVINGKSTSQSSFSYTYILVAPEEGTFTIDPASITVDGSNYQSNSVKIEVLPPDKEADQSQPSSTSESTAKEIKASDAFIRTNVSKSRIYEQEAFMVTFKLYTTLHVVDFGRIEFPEFEGFLVEELDVPSNQQLKLEHYDGRNYYTAVLRKTLLFPQRSGKMTIPSGRLEMVFSVPSGKKISSFFGMQEVNTDVKKPMITNPVTVNVTPLPSGKPASFKGAVGSFNFKPSISTQEIRANEPVTIKLELSGTGNHKLVQNPEIEFPTNFELYDPTIENDLRATESGLTGTRKIEYLVIPRYEGEYTIPPIEFSYFDIGSRSYKTSKSPSYSINVLKGDPSKATASTYVQQQEVKVEQDIRHIKTGSPKFIKTDGFFVGSWSYWSWYLIPFVLLFVFFILYRKQMKLNANIALMRTKRANRVAKRRLKQAEKHLKQDDKQNFYNEILRALWGYFSDKLSIPVANLTKSNIGAELLEYGVDETLIEDFMDILDTSEFARYAPVESSAAMGDIYTRTSDAIGKMENILK